MNRIWAQYFGRGLVETSEDFGIAGRTADAPRAARLARHRIRPAEVEPEGDAPADRHVGDLSASLAGHTGTCTKRDPYNRLFARGTALPHGRRDGARQCPGDQRSLESARSAGRVSSRTSRTAIWIQSVQRRQMGDEHERRPVPARTVHVLAADGSLCGVHGVRRAEPRGVHGAPAAYQYALAGPGGAQRQAVSSKRPRRSPAA